ncbi:MAG: YfhO family protein [bacterium]|nr:YfhO family protein [bacterium]
MSASIQRIYLHRIVKEKEFWGLILLGGIYFCRPLFLGETFFFRDLYLHSIADKQLLIDTIRSGELPLWNSFLLGGEPFLGNIASSALYPSNILFFIFPPIKAFNVDIVLHFLLALGSIYALARVLRFAPLTGFLVGLIYGFCGVMLSSTNLPGIWFDLPYFPLLLLFWHLFLSERKRRWFVISVFLGALQALVGSPEPNAIIMIFLLGWSLCSPYPGQSLLRRCMLWMLLGAFSVGLASSMILPTAEMVLQAGRQHSIEQATQFSLNPKRLLELVFPSFLGEVNAIRPRFRYWGWKLTKEYLPFFLNIYWGWVTLFLTVAGSVWKDLATSPSLTRKSRAFCAFFAGACLLISFGDYWPFFQELYLKLPFHSLFASPVKLFIGMLLPVALLAGCAAERCFRQGEILSVRTLSAAWGLTILLTVVAIWFRFSAEGSTQFVRQFFELPDAEKQAIEGFKSSLSHAAIIFLVFAVLLSYRRFIEKRWHYYAFIGLLVVDFLVAGQAINFYAPEDFFTEIPDVASLVRNEIGDGRFFHTKNPSNFSLQAPSDDLVWLSRWNLEVLSSYTAYHYKIPVIFYDDPNNLGQAQLIHLWSVLQEVSWPRKIPILSTGAVSLLMTSTPLSLPDLELIAEIPNRSNLRMFLYRNLRAAKRVEFVSDWELVSSGEEALDKISSPSFDPRKQVVLQTNESETSSIAESGISAVSESAHIRKISSNSHSAKFSVKSVRAGFLVFSEPFYPGWHISIDGIEVPILRANYAYSAIFVSKGEYEIFRWYRPDALLFGLLGSLVSFALLLLLVYKGRVWLE